MIRQPERVTDTHIYFWGSFYSQWAKYEMKDTSLSYNFTSCEQYMMWNKAILFNDSESAIKILATNNVKKQKELGRKVKNFDAGIWDEKKFNIVFVGNLLKFSQNEDLKKELLLTGDKIIVEASPYDKIYGVGLKWDNDLILDEKNWKGENLLGKAIMKVRETLRSNDGTKDKLKFYNKLVRDNIPESIESSGKDFNIVTEQDSVKLLKYYILKIKEESNEVVSSKNKKELIEELADLSEVIDSILCRFDLKDEVNKIKINKRKEKGGFSNIILKSVGKKNHEWINSDKDFRVCKECGFIENKENTEKHCLGEQKVKLRMTSDDFDKIENELKTSSLAELKLENAFKKVDELPDSWFGKDTPLFSEKEESILDAKEDIIAQGCNCAGVSGAGIAKYIGQKYPESDNKYKNICKEKKFKLGSVMFNKEKGKVQAFCGTQEFYGKFLKMDNDSIENRYRAIEICLVKIYKKAKENNLSVALPQIGCGRARADWNRVKGIIKKVFHDYPVTIYWIPDSYSKKKGSR